MPSVAAAASARAGSRDAIATIRQWRERCIAGITFWVPILAVLMTPKRTGSIAESSRWAFGEELLERAFYSARSRGLSRRLPRPPRHLSATELNQGNF